MARKSKNIDNKITAIVRKYEGEFDTLDENSLYYSRKLFSLTEDLFIKINKLGNEGLINYFQGLDKQNIIAHNRVHLEKIQLLFLFIIRTHNEDKFAQLLHSFYKDPNNTLLYTEEIKPKKSVWKIINFLQALINLFKRKKFKLINPVISKLYAKDTYKKFQEVNTPNYSNFKEKERELLSEILTPAIEKIFSIELPQDQAEQIANTPTDSFLIVDGKFLEAPPLQAYSFTSDTSESDVLLPPPPPPPPRLQASEKSRQSNVKSSHLESAVTTVNRVRPPLLREKNVTNQSSTLKKEQKLVLDEEASGGMLLAEIRDGIKLKPIEVRRKKNKFEEGEEPDPSLLLNKLKNSLQVYEESNEKTNERIAKIIARKTFCNQSSSSSFSSQDSSGDEWSDDDQAPSILTRGKPKISERTLNSRTSDSGHGSSISSLASEEPSETFKELGSVIKQVNTTLFNLNKGSGSEKDEKQPIENTSYSVKELRQNFHKR